MKLRSVVAFAVGCLLAGCSATTHYDVIIVGGGMAGLAAANELQQERVLLLEKADYLGGRVETGHALPRYFFDRGAVFMLDTSFSFLGKEPEPFLSENDNIAIAYRDSCYSGPTPISCLRQLPGINQPALELLYQQKNFNPATVDTGLYPFLNTLIKAVFPGALKNYNRYISGFTWQRYNSSHYLRGNQVVAEQLVKHSKAEFRLQHRVLAVLPKNDLVQVIVTHDQRTDTLTAKHVIVATPAPVALQLIKPIAPYAASFLSGIKYAGYYTVSIGLNAANWPKKFAYVMPMNTGFSSILQQKTDVPNTSIFQCYIAAEDMMQFKDTNQMKTSALELIRKIWQTNQDSVLFQDIRYWPNAGVLVNQHYDKKWNDQIMYAHPRVMLAGDYCNSNFMPYGMIPAILSGQRAAKAVQPKFPWASW